MRGVIGRPEGGRDRVPICEIDGDRLDPDDRPARKRPHFPALPFQFDGYRVADDAAAAGNECYALSTAARHIEPPGSDPKSVRALKAHSSRRPRAHKRTDAGLGCAVSGFVLNALARGNVENLYVRAALAEDGNHYLDGG